MDRAVLLASSPDVLSPPQQPDGSPSADANRAQFELTLAGESAGARMGVPRRARQRHSLRSALGAAAVGRASADPRQHHRHHRAQAHRAAGRRRAARVRAPGSERRSAHHARSDHGSDRTRLARYRVRAAPARRDGHATESLRRPAPARRLRARLGDDPGRGAQRFVCGGRLSAAAGHRRRHRSRRAVGEHARRRAGRWPAQLLVDADSRLRRPHPRDAGAVLPNAAQSIAPRLRADGAHDAARRHRDRASHGRKAHCVRARRAIAACSTT